MYNIRFSYVSLLFPLYTGEQANLPIQGLRLLGGSSIGSGRVEIRINNVWAQICADLWNLNDALVVCRYLGFNTTQQVPIGDVFGVSTTGYWATQMRCSGEESDLNQCHYTEYINQPVQICSVGYPANVRCLGMVLSIMLIICSCITVIIMYF